MCDPIKNQVPSNKKSRKRARVALKGDTHANIYNVTVLSAHVWEKGFLVTVLIDQVQPNSFSMDLIQMLFQMKIWLRFQMKDVSHSTFGKSDYTSRSSMDWNPAGGLETRVEQRSSKSGMVGGGNCEERKYKPTYMRDPCRTIHEHSENNSLQQQAVGLFMFRAKQTSATSSNCRK